MRPKFEIGEVVILQSPVFNKYNGEYSIGIVLKNGDKFTCRQTGEILLSKGSGYLYVLNGPLVDERGYEITFAESSLRKKHQPGEVSFTDLMASLSSPKLITHQA